MKRNRKNNQILQIKMKKLLLPIKMNILHKKKYKKGWEEDQKTINKIKAKNKKE
jgi:hypothetical protein